MTAKRAKANTSANPIADDTPSDPKSDYIVDQLFRRGAISLIGGATYAGKTTLMFQIIRDWMAGSLVFGKESHPAPCCYVTTIHTTQHARDVMARVGAEVQVLSTLSSAAPRSFETVCQDAIAEVPDIEVIFLDGIHPICAGNSNDPGVVTSTLAEISRLLGRYNLTLVASGCSSKPKDHYSSSRDRFAGAYSWLQGSSAFVSIDFTNPDNPADVRRIITVHSKSGLADRLHYKFNPQGILVPMVGSDSDPFQRYEEFDTVLFSHEPGTVLSRDDIVEIGELFGLSESTVKRRLLELLDEGKIGKPKWGHYMIERSQ
jgi:AAA domain